MSRRRLVRPNRKGIPNFAGLSLTRLFAFFQPLQATIDYPMTIDDGGVTKYVFFDDSFEISENSTISTVPSPVGSSEVLGDLVIPAANIFVKSLFCIVSGLEVPQQGNGAAIIKNGVLLKDGNRVTIDVDEGQGAYGFKLVGTALAEANNSFSTIAIGRNQFRYGFNWHPRIELSATSFATYRHRHTQTSTGDQCQFRNTGGTQYNTTFSGITNTTKQRTVSVVDKNNVLTAYKNGVFDDEIAITGNLSNNTDVLLYARYGTNIGNDGYGQLVAVCSKALTAQEVFKIDNELRIYYST